MINIIVAYDNEDVKLGTYFENCKNQLLSILEEHHALVNNKPHEVSTRHCNNVYIDLLLPKYNAYPFIFIAYSHGNEKALCCRDNNYVEKDANTHNFTNSLFYTTACSVGKELGEHLISKGCLAFIGYKNSINVYRQDIKNRISMNCDNAGIITFLLDDITIFEAYERMKNFYTQQIDKLYEVKDMLFAADLVETLDALVFFGNRDLRKEDLFLPK